MRHYHYRVLTKQSGAVRLIEAPKPRLKELQRTILSGILEKIPPHPAVHGFLKGHSIKTFVAPHVAQRVILKMDLEDFFPRFPGPGCKPSSELSAIPNPSLICSAVFARRPLRTTSGSRATCTRNRISRKGRRPLRLWRTSVPIASIAACPAWRSPLEPSIPATPTIGFFR